MLAGCAAHRPAPDPPAWTGAEALPARTVEAAELMPAIYEDAFPVTRRYETVESGGPVRIVTERAEGSGRFRISEWTGDETVPGVVSEIELTDRGVSLVRITNRERSTITDFRPPMLLVPTRAEPGFELEQRLAMIVHPIDHPDRVQNRGTAEYTLTYSGRTRVDLPGGPVEAARFVEVLDASFTGAGVLNTTRKWYAIGDGPRGLIARQSEESISVLGLPAERKTREIRRLAD